MQAKELTISKSNGRIYTPDYIVDNILDLSGYTQNNVIRKHVIDNSCGDGAFLTKIVDRYCKQAQIKKYNPTELRQELETYIHGIEIDSGECEKCIKNVTAIAMQYGIENVHWDIQCENTLTVKRFNGKMDFVVGNPPYVRVHNLDESLDLTKTFSFAQDGMTDLYIVFYEIGLKMLNEKGVLGYITPSSYFNSLAGSYMRKTFVSENLVDIIVDLKHFQAFNATTYTEITILKKDRTNNTIEYYQFDEKNHIPYYVETLSSDDLYIWKFLLYSKKRFSLVEKSFFQFRTLRCRSKKRICNFM